MHPFTCPANVLGVGDAFKVCDVHAVPDGAQVVPFQSWRKHPTRALVCVGVCENHATLGHPKAPIAFWVDSSRPKVAPTRIDPHFSIKALIGRKWAAAAMSDVGLEGTLGADLSLGGFICDVSPPTAVVARDEAHRLSLHPTMASVGYARNRRRVAAAALTSARLVGKPLQAYRALVGRSGSSGFRQMVVRDVSRPLIGGCNYAATAACATSFHRSSIA